MNHYIDAFKNYANFSGRATRTQYWMFVLFNFIISLVLSFVLTMTIGDIGNVLYAIYGLAVLIPSLAISVRRLHDTNRSGWWILISLVPLIGSIWLLILLCLDSVD